MKCKIDKQGRIYIHKPYMAQFPVKGEIIVDERVVSVSTTKDGRSFICGLKGYLEEGLEFDIIRIQGNEYNITVPGFQWESDATLINKKISRGTDSNFFTRPIDVNVLASEKTVEDKAVRLFEEYMQSHSDRFEAIVENGKVISDIRKCRRGYETVFADYVVYDKIEKKKVFFEIKGTSKKDQYWGGVTFKELKSAIDREGDYFFAIISTDNKRKDPFIHNQRTDKNDPYGVFMTLDEFMRFSTRASLGIQFVIKYPNGEDGELLMTKNGENAYEVNYIKDILTNKYIKKLISD